MMWHWNSLWAPAPGDPPAIDDPRLWQAPWSAEQAIALQARSWEAALSAAHSWWSMMLAAWPAGTASWPALPTWNVPLLGQKAAEATQTLQAEAAGTSEAKAAEKALEKAPEKASAKAASRPARKRPAASTRKR